MIDLGPEGGEKGGRVLVAGTPEQVAKHTGSYTGAFLKKILKPGAVSIDLAVQDSAIFFRSAKLDDMYTNPDKYLGKVSTSTKQIGSTTVAYILYSEKTDKNKFGGGSTENELSRPKV